MKHLVTGGAGFIGSNIVNRLVEDGHDVIVIDNESSDAHDHFYYNDKAEYHKLDICDPNTEQLYDGVDTVFHLAAESRIQPTIENPLQAVMTNSYGTCAVLQYSRNNNVRRVVYSSTSSAYGLINDIPNHELQPEDCLNPYSVSKVSGEKLCKMYSDLFGLETVIFRYFNIYGKHQPIRGQYAPVVGRFLDQYQKGQPLTIVPDGEQRRDYIHVSDVVEVNILASTVELGQLFDISTLPSNFQKYFKIGYGEIFNVGTGTNYSVNELAAMISDKTILIEPRPGESKVTLADINKTSKVLKWTPKVKLENWIKELL